MGTAYSKEESGLTGGTTYTRYVWAYSSCGISAVTSLTAYLSFWVGQNYGGGIIFYTSWDGETQHGLIEATSDQSTGAPWGCTGTLIGGTSTDIGTAHANTLAIYNGCSTSGIAACICYLLVWNGYLDWYLP